MKIITLSIIVMLLAVVLSHLEAAPQLTKEQLEEWFMDDERLHPFDKKSDDGQLVFLTKPPVKRTTYSRNTLTLSPHSLDTGWVKIEQCHEQLDPIGEVEVVYRYKQMRGLKVTSYSRIGKVWVEGQSIQLEDVEKDAILCMQAEARILRKQADGSFVLTNGPFQRRFLDSYFPMHVSLRVSYPANMLYLANVKPATTAGFSVEKQQGSLYIDTWFEGKLIIKVEFKQHT